MGLKGSLFQHSLIDEFTRECLRIKVDRKVSCEYVIDELFNLFIFRGIPEHIRSDNGPEFTAGAVRRWLNRLAVKTLFIERRSPWENGYIESFNGKLRDELLNREMFSTLEEARVLIEQWRGEYNQLRPDSALGYRSGTCGYTDHDLRSGIIIGGRSVKGQEFGLLGEL
jgi:transposase InsO family protein